MKHKAVSVYKPHDPGASIKNLTSSRKVKEQQAAYSAVQVSFALKEGHREECQTSIIDSYEMCLKALMKL